jgi:ABC-type polysaccharide/polyol phosphate transport system ATPase subunit
MIKPVIEVNNVGKRFKLGEIGGISLRDELILKSRKYWQQMFKREKTKVSVKDSSFWALREVTFSVERGEVLGVIGLNGAGKSTLLKILSRVTEPTEGEVILRGKLASLLEVGTGFHPELTGRENVYLNGAILGMKRDEMEKKFSEIIEFSEIGEFVDTPVKRYSSGMYVRLAFSVAIHLEPEILIVDEVLAVGDFMFQSKCVEKMRKLTESGRTILFVSHNLYTLQTLCKTGLLLRNGRVVMKGSMQQAIAAYRDSTNEIAREETHVGSKAEDGLGVARWTVNGSTDAIVSISDECDLLLEWEFSLRESAVLCFGVSIKSVDGIYVCGISTFVEERSRYFECGVHVGSLTFRDLDLPSGSYRIAFAVMNELGVATFFHREEMVILSVVRRFRFDGAVGLRHEWKTF